MTGPSERTREPLVRELMARIEALPMSRWHYGMIVLTGAGLIFDTADAGLASASQVGVRDAFGVQQVQLGLLVSAAFIGATVSAALIGFLADRFGRRTMIAVSILVFSLATAAAALSQNFTQLVVFRIVAGIGYGGLLPLAWAFGSEFAPAVRRGRTLSWLNAFYGAGSALAYLVGLVIIVPLGWRWGFASFLIPALLAFLVLRFMPEGIPFLVRRGREREARDEVARIERRVLRGRPRPTSGVTNAEDGPAGEARQESTISALAATKQLFASRNLLRTVTIILAWPVPTVFAIGLISFYPLIFVRDFHLPLAEVLAFLTFSAFLTVVGRMLAGLLLDPIRRASPSGLKIYLAVGVILLGSVPAVILLIRPPAIPLLLLLCALYLLQGMWAGGAMTYVPTVMPLAIRNAGLGLFSALTNVAQIIGPLVVGAILEFSGLRTIANWTLIVSVVCAVFVGVFGHREKLTTVRLSRSGESEHSEHGPEVRR